MTSSYTPVRGVFRGAFDISRLETTCCLGNLCFIDCSGFRSLETVADHVDTKVQGERRNVFSMPVRLLRRLHMMVRKLSLHVMVVCLMSIALLMIRRMALRVVLRLALYLVVRGHATNIAG